MISVMFKYSSSLSARQSITDLCVVHTKVIDLSVVHTKVIDKATKFQSECRGNPLIPSNFTFQLLSPLNNLNIPANGNWGRWSRWGRCSRSCMQTRHRACDSPVPKGSLHLGNSAFHQSLMLQTTKAIKGNKDLFSIGGSL